MPGRNSAMPMAAMFLIFAAVFSIVLWPEVSSAAKIAFFATGVGCGIGIGRFVGGRTSGDGA